MDKFRILFFFLLITKTLFSQTGFYNVDSIREIKVYFNEPNWDHILDSLYVEGEKNRLLCSVEVDGNWIILLVIKIIADTTKLS